MINMKHPAPKLESRAVTPDRQLEPAASTSHNALPVNCHLAIDNGLTGAMALLLPDDTLFCHPVLYRDLGKERLLDVPGNLAVLQKLLAAAAASNRRALVIFEQSPITPLFGAKNNYVNGRNNEFWRVLLTLEMIPFAWVNPRHWQKDIFRGIRGRDTKEMARLVVEQRFPRFQCPDLNASQREGVNDAICIALWARESHR